MASSPESTAKLSGTAWKMAAICEMFPDASFTPNDRLDLGQPLERRRLDVRPGAAGTL